MTYDVAKKMKKEETEIIDGMKGYLAYLKGENPKAVVAVWECASKREVKKARGTLKASLTDFARLLRVSPKTVEAWERGSKPPSGPATTWVRSILNDPKLAQKALLGAK